VSPFAVIWLPNVLSDLATLWVQAPNRRAVTDAQARIDQLLGANPTGHGRHLSEGLYHLHVPPLAVTYTIDTNRRRVEVTSVHHVP